MGRRFENILETVGRTPVVEIAKLAPAGGGALRQAGGLQSARVRQGQAGAGRDRSGGAQRRAEAGADRHRGDQRQHRHRSCHGLRAKRLSARRHHGGEFQRRAAQADAFPGRQGYPDAGVRKRQRHGRQGAGTRAKPMAGSSAGSSRTKRTRTSIPKPPPSKSWRTSRETGSTIGSPAWARAGRSRALREC